MQTTGPGQSGLKASKSSATKTGDPIEAEAVARFEKALAEYRAHTLAAKDMGWIGSAVERVIALGPFAFVRRIRSRFDGDK